MHSPETLSQQLNSLGLRDGDTVMVHASLRKLGPVAGGANGLIASIMSSIGDNGTMLMILGSPADVVFDYRNTPADPEMGVLAEQFRTYPNTAVNDHPAARLAANGKQAEPILRDPPLDDYYQLGSPVDRLRQYHGKILRLAPNIDTTTLTHVAEYAAKVSPKKVVLREYNCIRRGQLSIRSLDDCLGIQDWPEGDYFGQIMRDYLQAGHATQGPVGNCQADLIDASHYYDFAVTWLEGHLSKTTEP